MQVSKTNDTAIWVITPNGLKLAGTMRRMLNDADVYVSNRIGSPRFEHFTFQRLSDRIGKKFDTYSGHIFIMSTGIVVRVIAPLIQHKTKDPAVVVVDDGGNFAVSLISGHLGGANQLTRKIADIIGARPVITTATDVNQLPAIDVLAKEKKLIIENPAAIKTVNMAILKGEKVFVHDPLNLLANSLPNAEPANFDSLNKHLQIEGQLSENMFNPGVFIDDARMPLSASILVLRPATLVAGIGCNRHTATEEIKSLLKEVLDTAGLSLLSLKCLASIDVKSDENGLIAVGREFDLPLMYFRREELNQVINILNPSTVVEKHVGVKSVCEAAAILGARNGTLIVPKQKTKNVTVAIARIDFSLSASDPAVSTT